MSRDLMEVSKRIVATVYNNLDGCDSLDHRPVWKTDRKTIEDFVSSMILSILEDPACPYREEW
jgi:hypothetical protein